LSDHLDDRAGEGSARGQRDRAEEGFERGASNREERREERRVQSLLKDRHSDRSRIAELEARLAEKEARDAKGRVSLLDADMASAEAEARDAFADGDADKASRANRRMAELAAERKAAELEGAQAERNAANAKRPAVAAESADWIERNSGWFKKDEKKTKLALIAHEEAVTVEGLQANSPEYFEFIEQRVEDKFPGTVARDGGDELEDEPEERPAPRQVSRGPAAVSRQSAPPATRGRTITATAAQVEAAKIAGVPIQDYMARRSVLARTGRLEVGRR
jgi:hypothetical protein